MSDVAEHPAVYSDGIVDLFRDILDRRLGVASRVVDPFAGVGGIHGLRPDYNTLGVELEQEWADQHMHTAHGDARNLLAVVGWYFGFPNYGPDKSIDQSQRLAGVRSVDAVATSCTYGNRMADSHVATDDSKRITYTHKLGRKLTEGNSGAMQWGSAYRELHTKVWFECRCAIRPGGLLILNISNHFRKGAKGEYVLADDEVNVAGWHTDTITGFGFELVEAYAIPTKRMRFGANSHRRTSHEFVLVFRLPNRSIA